VRVLAMNVDQALTHFSQCGDSSHAVVYVCTTATLTMQYATQDGFYITIGTRCNESRLNTSFLGTVSNDRDISTLANH
jgi:hypothetical protein